MSLQLFRRQVAVCSDAVAGSGQVLAEGGLGDAEIQEFDFGAAVDFDIGGLEVAVDDAA
jgi:hypothetical protein